LNLFEGGNRASPIPSEFPYLNAEAAPPFCYQSGNVKSFMVAATFKLRKRRLIHKTQAKACGYQLQKEKNYF